MASSPQSKDRVFLSYGEDIEKTFISHLLNRFRKEFGVDGIFTADDLPKGVEMSSIDKEIEESKVWIIVFSVGYAHLRCLQELAKIVECKEKNKGEQILIPVLHGLHKSDIIGQSGEFGRAFAELEEGFKEKCKPALNYVLGLKYWNSMTNGNEKSLVEDIVSDVLKRLKDISTRDSKDGVGLKLRVQKLEELLSGRPEMTCTLGLWGDPGMGKTTLASAIFEKISGRFEVSHFVEYVSKRSKGTERKFLLQELQTKMGDKTVPKKVLIVFDDVTDSKQIDSLRKGRLFSRGSVVIIVARFESVLNGCSVDVNYKVERLSFDEGHMLFKWCVYGKNNCTDDYPTWSKQMVECANYGPLALKVLGSCLFCKIKKDWERVLQRLSEHGPLDIYGVLRIGYKELLSKEQELLKKIVGHYVGEDVEEVKSALKRLRFKSVDRGIKVLEQRSLIAIIDNKITVHDLIIEMVTRPSVKRKQQLDMEDSENSKKPRCDQ